VEILATLQSGNYANYFTYMFDNVCCLVEMETYIENRNAGGCCSKPIERAAGKCCSEAFHVAGTLMGALGSLFLFYS
jgi:hypothetical protein